MFTRTGLFFEIMKVIKTKREIRQAVQKLRADGRKTALVPTMGALHEGHVSLIKIAKELTDDVIVSIFVNPTQFAPGEDFEKYPRPIEQDIELCRNEGVSVVFTPSREEMYRGTSYISFDVKELGSHLCGRSRPGHFNGVLQIVNKLFNNVPADVAVFGQKDIQQFRILETMADEFDHDIEIVMSETIRAEDGLALSSRNRYLSPEERQKAPMLNEALLSITQKAASDATPTAIVTEQSQKLESNGLKVDYLQIVDYNTLQPVQSLQNGKKYIAAGAIYLGNTRLIDNRIFQI